MEIDKIKNFFQNLEEIRTYLKCQYCGSQDKILARIKVCGHYMCEKCLNNSKKDCPKCKIFYNDWEVDWNNIYIQTQETIFNLYESLSLALESNKSTNEEKKENIITYQNKCYQLNFIEEHKKNAKGETSLHVACRRKKISEVNNLLTKIDINAQDYAGWVPLHEAIEVEDYEIVEILLKNGALTDTPGPDYKTPLHKAVVCKNVPIIKLLLEYGANKDAIDYFGKIPLDYGTKEIELIFNEQIDTVDVMPQLFCSKGMVAYCYYVDPIYINKLKQNKIKVEESYNPKKVTHFILKKTHKISVKILTAMLNGCTIVPQEYIDNYLKQDFYIPIPNYTFLYLPLLNTGIQKSMMNSLLRLPKLFDGISFYITYHFTDVVIYDIKVKKSNLEALIIAGDGIILNRAPTPSTCDKAFHFPFHASKTNSKCCNYILYEEHSPPLLMYNMAELKHKSSKWLFDCALKFTILD